MTARTCNNCGQEFDTGECGANHGCAEQVTTEKETPTPKTVEEVNYETRDYDGIRWIRFDHYTHAITVQNQAADERLRDVVREILAATTTPICDVETGICTDKITYQAVKYNIEKVLANHGITNL